MTNVVFAGDTMACFRHYAETLPCEKAKVVAARQPLVEFTGAPTGTAQNWFRGVRTPNAMNLLRVRLFLHFNGYAVAELEVLQPAVFELCKCYALGVYNIDEVKRLISYASETSVMTLFLSNPGLAPHKERRLVEEFEKTKAEREQEITRVLKRHNFSNAAQHSGAIMEPPPLTPEQAVAELRDLLRKVMPIVEVLTALDPDNPELKRLRGIGFDLLSLKGMLLDLHGMIPERSYWQKK